MMNNKEKKPLLFVDMDNVLADFGGYVDAMPEEERKRHIHVDPESGKVKTDFDEIPGIFSHFKPVEGAIEAMRTLKDRYDIYILSTAPWNNPTAWADKLEWIKKYFGDIDGGDKGHFLFWKRLILCHHKDLLFRDDAWLIDDAIKNGTDVWKAHGRLLQFGVEHVAKDWATVTDFLMHIIDEPIQGIPMYTDEGVNILGRISDEIKKLK